MAKLLIDNLMYVNSTLWNSFEKNINIKLVLMDCQVNVIWFGFDLISYPIADSLHK